MRRIGLGLVLVFGVLAAVVAGPAAATSVVPQAGNWEGTGPHGLPLSFELVRHGGRLVATSVAVGYPGSCPAASRNAEGIPLAHPSYTGPGGASAPSSSQARLTGQVPSSSQPIYLSGAFSTARTGRFSIQDSKPLGCGWPEKTLTWNVRRAARRRVTDGTWTGPLTATGLINGNVRLVVGAHGRVIDSFTTFFTCLANSQQGNTTFRAVPAYEFIAPGGGFSSPLNGGSVSHHPTMWSGRFSASGQLAGSLSIFDNCTNQMIRAEFTARRTRSA